ncbi:hypothetical protein [Actinopolymorpha alba]|uniref:hypothetical protein n=1 Tax=Actinopolymorpha alba TaxID=533267 RepID=UPI00039B3D24|nr:hypothetical protein [Actinopolymorpha alba]
MSDVPSPRATRQPRPRWLDPKLFLGILLVLASMALGARVIAQADATVEVWAVKDDVDLVPPATLTQDQLIAKTIRFTSQGDADRYVSAREQIPAGARMVRAVGGGEFLPRDSWTNKPDTKLRDAPVPIAASLLPKGIKVGDRVDIYFVAGNDDTFPPKKALLAASDVIVVALPSGGGLSGGDASATIRVALDQMSTGLTLEQLVADAANAKAVVVKHVAPEPKR